MRKLFSGLILFFISCATFADSAWNVSGAPTPVASHTDLSIAYLAQVFGTVGSSLQGTSGQMLGMLFSKFNEGVLVVAGIWLTYTIVTIVLRSAMDGSFMGPNKNVFWIIIRIALAFAMLIPGPMTGYNIIQDMVMKVVVEGVSLADQTWNMGLGYIYEGGSLWHRPESTNMGNLSSTAAQAILNPAGNIFLDEVCMIKSSSINQNPSTKQSSAGGIANISAAKKIQYNIVTNDGTHTFYFPGLGNGTNYASNLSANPITTIMSHCGYVSWSSIPGANCTSSNTASCLMAKAAVSQMVYDMLPAAKEYVRNDPNDDILNDNSQAFFNSFVNYVNAVMPIAQRQANGASVKAKDFIPAAMSEGWMMAGRYYWDLSQIQSNYAAVSNISTYVPTVWTSAPSNKTVAATITAAATQSKLYMSNPSYNSSQPMSSTNQPGAVQLLANYNAASGAGDTGGGVKPGGAALTHNWLLSTLLEPLIGNLVALFSLFRTNGALGGMGIDPILFLHNVGMQCINIAGYIWFDMGISIFGILAMTIICQSTVNLSTPIKGITGWIKTPLMVLAGALLGVGVLLGFYVPLYPFMLFIFGVIGWIILVIEAMVAAPLIAFGLTSPENHEFLGEAKQGLILLLGVFLRPVLMIIGLIAGMILSYVSLRILVYTYSGFLQDLFWVHHPIAGASGSIIESAAATTVNVMAASGSVSGLIMSLFTFPLMLGVFAALVYVVTTQCFSLIYVLPDYILRWIGGPATNPGGVGAAQMAQQIQGAMGGMARTTGETINAGKKAKAEADKEKSKNTTEHNE